MPMTGFACEIGRRYPLTLSPQTSKRVTTRRVGRPTKPSRGTSTPTWAVTMKGTVLPLRDLQVIAWVNSSSARPGNSSNIGASDARSWDS